MMRRFTISSLAAVMVLGTVTLPAAAQDAGSLACPDGAPDAGFRDVPAANVHSDAIDCGASLDLILGKTSTTFEPATSVTRGQIASLLARTLDELDTDLPGVAGAPTFSDIGAPHGDNIRRLASVGIVQGRTDGSYGPQDAVRRDQLASLFVRAMEFALGDELVPDARNHFTDVRDGVHAVNIDLAFELGILKGKTDGRFAPRDATRRDQAASVVIRFMDELIAILDAPFDLTVLHINDGESALLPEDLGGPGGDPGVARFIADLFAAQDEASSPVTTSSNHDEPVRTYVTISAGDNFLAGPQLAASLDDPNVFYDAFVYLRGEFDAMTIGNHEFDFGPDLLADFIEAVEDIPFISANLDVSGEPRLAALEDDGRIGASTTFRRAGRDIAVIGATTELLPTISTPRNATVSAVLPAVQAEVDAVRAAGAEIVLLSSHLQNINEEVDLVPQLSGVDAIIGGGGGENLRDGNPGATPPVPPRGYPLVAQDADGNDVPVVTAPGRFQDIGKLVLEFAPGGGLASIGDGSELAAVPVEGPTDGFMTTTVVEPIAEFVEELAENVIGTTEVPLDGRRNDGVRLRETNLGDMIADALLITARENAAAIGAPPADLALQNGGGIRNESIIGEDATPGDPYEITELDTFNIAPFSNFVSVSEIPVDTLRAALERSVSARPGAGGQHGQWAGIEFTFDDSEPVGSRIIDATVTRGDGDASTDVPVVVAGVTADLPGVTFAIASNNFTLRGGDAYPFSAEEFPLKNTSVSYQQALLALIEDLGTVTAANYPDLTVDFDRYRRFGPVGGTFIDD